MHLCGVYYGYSYKPAGIGVLYICHTQGTVLCRINAPCALADTLVHSGGPGEHYSGVLKQILLIFDQFSPIFGNIPSESAGVLLF